MKKEAFDSDKLFMTQFLVVSVLSNNVSLDIDEICEILNRTLSLHRSKIRVESAINVLKAKGVVLTTEFGNLCLSDSHKHMLRA